MGFDAELDRAARDVPVLLAMSEASAWNMHLQDALADRHDRDVWAPNGVGRWVPSTDDSDRHVFVLSVREHAGLHAQWLLRQPSEVRVGARLPHGGAVDWARPEIAYPLAGSDHRLHAFISMDLPAEPDQGYLRSTLARLLENATSWITLRTGRVGLHVPHRLPWLGGGRPRPVFVNYHGGAGWSSWFTPHGVEEVDAPETGRRVARLVSLFGLSRRHPLVLLSCFGAMPGGTDRSLPNPPVHTGRSRPARPAAEARRGRPALRTGRRAVCGERGRPRGLGLQLRALHGLRPGPHPPEPS
ncbi:hypothetical protein IHE61_27210 [Streptomyces sp. GKU 257-1]|nr:hypothetical protein [Streptomyces sp. GKU 257-1]